MNETVQNDGLNLLDLLKILWAKIKVLILVLVCGCIAGGTLGFLKAEEEQYYGTKLEFYVNPEADGVVSSGSTYGVYGAYGRHVMDNIIKLLSSEQFSEELMLGFEDAPTEKEIIGKDGKKSINPEYKDYLNKVRNSVIFTYLDEEVDVEDAVNLARSFIYVEIAVEGEENIAFAEELLSIIREKVPNYVCQKMIIPEGYIGTNCVEITAISEIIRTNPGHGAETAIKFALLAGVAALVIACVVVIIVDRSDKRVRDCETITRQLKIPVLGVIPSISDENFDSWNTARKEGKVN